MKLNIKTILQTLFFALLGVGLIYWRFTTMTPEDKAAMFQSFDAFNWNWSLAIFAMGVFSHFIRAKRWELQFDALAIPYTTTKTFTAVMLGYLTNIFIPRLGEVTKCTYIAKDNGTATDKIIGTVIAERLWDTICFLFLTILTLVLQFPILLPYAKKIFGNLSAKLHTADGNLAYLKIGILVSIIVVGIVAFILLYRKLRDTKIGKFIDGVKKGLQSIYQVKKKGLFIAYTLLLWLSYTLVAILVMKAIPGTEHLPLLAGLSIITFGTFAMIVPAPGSIAYPLIVAPILTLYGTSTGVGQGYGWINWANQNITIIITSLVLLLIAPLIKNKAHVHKN